MAPWNEDSALVGEEFPDDALCAEEQTPTLAEARQTGKRLWIIDPNGKKLGRIVHGAPATTNLAFGGADGKTLYFTSRNHLGAVKVKIPGMPVPTQKKERS